MTHFERKLMWSVQALAQREEIQRSLFPSFVAVADELALEFEKPCRSGAMLYVTTERSKL